MKRTLHIGLLIITLLWAYVPQSLGAEKILHEDARVQASLDDTGQPVFLINLTTNPDLRFDFITAVPLPDPSQADFGTFFVDTIDGREYGSFIESHHIYTQITSSDL
jgi:hypothetical protein